MHAIGTSRSGLEFFEQRRCSMFRWLLRIGLGFLVAKLAETYTRPSRRAREKPFADKPAPKPRTKKT
jgi:hypothetical protein